MAFVCYCFEMLQRVSFNRTQEHVYKNMLKAFIQYGFMTVNNKEEPKCLAFWYTPKTEYPVIFF